MAIPLVAVAGKITAALMNQVIGQVNGIALNGIVPTSISGPNGTSAISPGGKVTFSNVASISLNGVFTGTYDNYRITWNSPTRSASANTQLRLRAAGNDLQSNNYDWVRGYDTGSTRTVASSSSSGSMVVDTSIGAGQTSDGVLDLYGPALAQYTSGTAQVAVLASSVPYSFTSSVFCETTTAYDGITLYPSTGTWSGTVRVYGYNTLT